MVGKIKEIIESYILRRIQMTCLFVLIDSRLTPQKNDLQFIECLGENGITFDIIFTKTDKQSKTRTDVNIKNFISVLKEQWEELPPYFASSSLKKTGKEEILDYIESINSSIAGNNGK